MRTNRFPIFLAGALLALPVAAPADVAIDIAPAPWLEPNAEGSARSDSYRAGQRALDAEDWEEAVERFAEAVAQGGEDADGALYWQAYALLKLNRAGRAQLALEALQERFPESNWVDDARALELEVQRRDRQTPDPEAVTDEELKLIALNSLIHLEWERARPLLEQFLADASPKMMERALFVLSQSDAPEARQMLLDIASDPSAPELAGEAVHYLAFYDDQETRTTLRQLYAGSSNAEVRGQVLEAMMIAEDLEGLLPIARHEPDPELRETAVELLGMLEATAELRQLYKTESSTEVRQQIIDALMLAGDKETLLELSRTEADAELRATAVEQLGLLDATPELRELYRNESSAEIRQQIAAALMLAGDADFLIEIAKTDADAEVRNDAIEGIGLIDSPEARAALSSLYENATDIETKRRIIEALMLQDDAAALIGIARAEQAPELRRAAIEALSMMDTEAANDFMLEILEVERPD